MLMKNNIDFSASIVLYHNDKKQIIRVIRSILNEDLKIKIYLLDNSSNDDLKETEKIDYRVKYIFNKENLGYGTAHNIAIKKSISEDIPYHLVINPDIYFEQGVMESIFHFMELNQDVGNIMPKVLYPNGEIQYLCKLLPSPVDLIFRRFTPDNNWKKKRNNLYELRFCGYNKVMNVPYLSGCFMFLRTSVLEDIGLFDENIFMYLEDTDLSRRIHKKYKTVFYPDVYVYHEYEKGSYKNKKLLWYHIRSAIYYFNKWGWVNDNERIMINKKIIDDINNT